MAFLSHFKPNRIKIIPTTRRKSLMGTHLTSATPRVAIITARVAAAAKAPSSELRQLIVMPTTSTIVNASTNSTAEARNAAVAIEIGRASCRERGKSEEVGGRVKEKGRDRD